MKLTIEENKTHEEIEVVIKCLQQADRTVKRLINAVNSVSHTVKCRTGGNETWVAASDIYYVESVDKRTFLYCENSVYQTEYRLYQLKEELHGLGIIQVSKACLLNVNTLTGIRALKNSKMEATLSNGEKLHVSRKYISAIKAELSRR